VCGRALSANPFSSIGFERSHNQALTHANEDAFVRALLVDLPPPPADQRAIVAANRLGLSPTEA
jgi:hydroxyacylglutathione hydrolase